MNDYEFIRRSNNDELLNICKQRGYVKKSCVLSGFVVLTLVTENVNPCDGCNLKHICEKKDGNNV